MRLGRNNEGITMTVEIGSVFKANDEFAENFSILEPNTSKK